MVFFLARNAVLISFIQLYAELSKARLSLLVAFTTAAGFALAAPSPFPWPLFALTAGGTLLSAMGANAFNQWMEAGRDARMERTRERPLPSGRIGPGHAALVSGAMVVAGTAVLIWATNLLTVALNLIVVGLYLLAYTPLKVRTTLSTLIGAVCGAIPPMMGFSAVTGRLGAGAWILGAVLFAWQIPHFLALAWIYREDYARGGYLMLPIQDTTGTTTFRMILLYTLALLPLGFMATLAGLTGWVSAALSLILGGLFLALTVRLFRRRRENHARQVFWASLAYLPLVLGCMVADRVPPPEIVGEAVSPPSLPSFEEARR